MNIEQVKKALMDVYPGPNWRKKVERMSEGQAFAIYSRLKFEGKIK